jgi:peptidoglycan/LPS O-acetylase OafA/YrhL
VTSTLEHRRAPELLGTEDRFRPDIEGLRAVAIVLVVLGHVGLVPGGYVGVDVFFVLSGFLITSLLLREVATSGRISIRRFYARRALRLLPASTVVLLGTLIAAHVWLSPLLAGRSAADAAAAAGYVANLVFAQRGTDYLASDAAPSAFQHFWSLAVEEQFYLVWPLLIIALRGRRARLRYVLGSLAAVSLLLSSTETHRSAPWAYFGTHTRVWELAVGALLALFPHFARPIVGWAGLTAILVAALRYDAHTAYPGLYALLPVLGAAAVVAGGNRVLGAVPLTAVGRLSYGWYLWHWPVLIIGTVALGIAGTTAQKLALALAALGLAWLSMHLVENPIRYSRVLRSRPRYGLALGAALCTGVVLASLGSYAARPAISQGAAAGELRLSPDRPDQLAAAIRAGAALTELPANLRPSLAAAAADSPRVYADGCHAKPPTVRPASPCAYGDLGADRTVVLFGDSHAAQWFPALVRIALDRHWRLVSLTKSGCTAADATIWNDVLQRAYTECDAWRRTAIARIDGLRPALIVVSSTYAYRLTDPHATWQAAWARTFAALSPAPVAVLSDTPTMNVQVPECLSQHSLSACNREVAATMGQAQRRILAGFGGQVTVIDPVPWLCSTVCPTVLGNLLVYRDSAHLTAAMAEALAPLLAARLPLPE